VKLGDYVQLRFFSDLGNTTWEIFLSPIARPRIFWEDWLKSARLFRSHTLGASALLPVAKAGHPVRRSLTFMFDCLNPTLKSICYHYQAALLPVLFWALASSLQRMETRSRRAALLGVIASGALLSIFFGNTFWSKDTLSINLWPGRLGLVRRFGEQIDTHGSLFATQRVAAHFITQHHLFTDRPCQVRSTMRFSTCATPGVAQRITSIGCRDCAAPNVKSRPILDSILRLRKTACSCTHAREFRSTRANLSSMTPCRYRQDGELEVRQWHQPRWVYCVAIATCRA